jgi:cobalamin biosynthesis Mg chelatase CobN
MRTQNRSRYLTATLALALAALALIPTLAHAGSAEVIYHEGLEKAVNEPFEAKAKPSPQPKPHPGPSAASPTPKEPTVKTEVTEPSSEPEAEPETGHRDHAAAAPGDGGKHPPGSSGGRPDRGVKPQKSGDPGKASTPSPKPTPRTATGENAAATSGGSSPVVPILIVAAVLAAISVGVAYYWQRRDTPARSA